MDDASLIDWYLEKLQKIDGFRPQTLRLHRKVCNLFSTFLAQHTSADIDSARASELLAFVAHRQEAGIKHTSLRSELCALRTFYAELLRYSKVSWSPAASLPKMICDPPCEQDYLRVDECITLLNSFDTGKDLDFRNYVIVALLWSTGLRNNELCSLQWRDVDLQAGTLLVREGKGAKQRQLFLNDRVRGDLEALRKRFPASDHEPVFFPLPPNDRRHLSNVRLVEIVGESAAAAGLTKQVSPLTFRHTFATHMYENGVSIEDLRELMGHDLTTETTLYVHLSLDGAKQLLNDHIANPEKYLHYNPWEP